VIDFTLERRPAAALVEHVEPGAGARGTRFTRQTKHA